MGAGTPGWLFNGCWEIYSETVSFRFEGCCCGVCSYCSDCSAAPSGEQRWSLLSQYSEIYFFHIHGPKSENVLLKFIACKILFCFQFGKYAFSCVGHTRPPVPPSSQQRWHSYFCWHFRLELINIFIGAIINILWAGFLHPLNLLWLHFILEHISG